MKAPNGPVVERLAGAPISWGVCEVPGWGIMLPRSASCQRCETWA